VYYVVCTYWKFEFKNMHVGNHNFLFVIFQNRSSNMYIFLNLSYQNSYWRSRNFSYWTGQPLILNWVCSWSLQRGLHHYTFEKNRPGPIRCPIILTHFESISNIKTVGEDRSATARISHLNSAGFLPSLQLAYWANHSTETTVLKVLSDILLDIDSGDLSALVLLDL